MVFHVLGKLRRNRSSKQELPPEIEQKKTNDTSLGDTIPTKHQFYLETPVKTKAPESVEKLLLSFGHSPGEGIRTSSSVSSLSSNSVSTYDLPRRKSIEDMDDDSAASTRAAHPLAMCAPQYFEPVAPPLKDAKHVPTFWSTFFECCHPVLEVEPTYSAAPTDKTMFGRFLSDDEEEEEGRDDGETNEVAKKRGVFRAWTKKSRRVACGAQDSFFLDEADEQ